MTSPPQRLSPAAASETSYHACPRSKMERRAKSLRTFHISGLASAGNLAIQTKRQIEVLRLYLRRDSS